MFGRKRHRGTVLVVDVDDMSVGASVVRLGAKAAVAQSLRANVPPEQRTPDHSMSAVGQLLEETARKITEIYAADAKAEPISAAYAVVRSPWTRFRTAQAEDVYDTPQTVTEKMIIALTNKALQSPSELNTANRLESGVVHVYLNGYPTNNPVGKVASRLTVMAYESDINPDINRMVSDTLVRVLPGRTPVLRSSMCALLNVAGEHLPEMHRSVMLDVGSSSTHCAVVLKEAVTQTAVVNEGLTTVLSRIAGGALPEETLTQLRMLATDTCATDACKALKDSLARIEPELAKSFGEAFARLASKRRLPNVAMLSASAEIAPWMAGFFSRIDFAQFTATMQPLTVELLTADHLRDAIDWEGRTADTGIGIAAVYVNSLAANR